jgi:hypothetical protein
MAAITNNNDLFTSLDYDLNWTAETGAGSRCWNGATSSANGKYLAVSVRYGDIYI